MREIKFRAWYKPKQVMIYDIQSIYDGDVTAGDKSYNKFIYGYDNFQEILESDNFIVMEYTGLTTNGKDVYEGDIAVNHWYNSVGRFIGKKWVVKYGEHDVEGLDYYSNVAEGFYFNEIDGVETYNIVSLPNDAEKGGIEIVGNIYENPDFDF